VIEAFRRRGIYPPDVRTLAADALLWAQPTPEDQKLLPDFAELIQRLKKDMPAFEFQTTAARKEIDRLNHEMQYLTWKWIRGELLDPRTREARNPKALELLGLALGASAPGTVARGKDGLPSLEVHSVRSARRPLQNGRTILDLVVEMTQRRWGFFDPDRQAAAEKLPPTAKEWQGEFRPDFKLRGGCTLLINSESGEVRYCVVKSILSPARLARQRAFLSGGPGASLRAAYSPSEGRAVEPFALLHRSPL
jgi:hypothetical protein